MRHAAILLLLLFALPADAQTEIRVFELQYRSAEELIDVVGPLVDPEGTVTGSGFRLVVRSSPQNLAELAQALTALDTPRRQFMISVRQGAQGRVVDYGARADGRFETGDVDIEVGRGGPPRVQVYATEGERDERVAQQIRVIEGGWAFISAGQALPVPQQTLRYGPGGGTVQQSIEYRDVDTGFEVRPRLTGPEQVALDIRPFRARPSPAGGGVIEQQQLSTSVTTRIGEWVEIGGGSDTHRHHQHGILYSTQEQDALTRRVFVRVELLD